MLKQHIIIINKLGLHARASSKLVNVAKKYESEVKLHTQNKSANAKSIMGVMMLAASQGTELDLTSEGPDEGAAMNAVVELINNRFGESE